MTIYPVILAGGSGTRLWPLSRQNHPKQYLDVLSSGESLLQSTILRAQSCGNAAPIIVANAEHRFLLQHQLEEIGLGLDGVVLEPCARNTTGAIALACVQIIKRDPEGVLLILPADHYLPDTPQFELTINRFKHGLEHDEIGLLGVQPHYAATQYGYISCHADGEFFKVNHFIEKPDTARAQQLIDHEQAVWNSGMVLAKAQAIYGQLKLHAPEVLPIVEVSVDSAYQQYGFTFIGEEYAQLASEAFDVSVLEKSNKLKVVSLDQEWDDLGTWSALLKVRKTLGVPSFNTFSSGKTVLAFDADDMVLIENDDVIMAASQDALADMTRITQYLHANHLIHLLNKVDVHRPWGRFKVLAQDEHYIVKQLVVYPGAQISLQSHQYRQEHWVVVKGRASVQLDEETFELGLGEAISVGCRQKHRLSNAGKEPLEIIEVQSGSYLDESDIIRYDDEYNRHL